MFNMILISILLRKTNCFKNEPKFEFSAESSYKDHLSSVRKALSKIFEALNQTRPQGKSSHLTVYIKFFTQQTAL